MSQSGILEVRGREWHTPLTDVPERQVGAARLTHRLYGAGLYRMEGMDGFEYYRVRGKMPVADLQLRGEWKPGARPAWKTWMIDDPLHWYGMRERVSDLPGGHILCAGLGLGLMVHHLAARPDVTRITIVEYSQDVVDLIEPTLPTSVQGAIIVGDYYEVIRRPGFERPDAILWDLAVGGKEDTKGPMLYGAVQTTMALPGVPLYQFGLRGGRRNMLER